jgi:hypothetical protein
MNMVLALTFGEEIAKDVIVVVLTALVVTIGGGFVATKLTSSIAARRENFEVQTRLLEQVSRTAQKMYVACQHTRRILRKDAANTVRGADALVALDNTYQEFSADAEVLETVIGARYGVSWAPADQRTKETPASESNSNAFWRWHQIKDLLTAYYFNLKGSFPGDALERNMKGHRGKFHSGLDLKAFIANQDTPQDEELHKMRKPIRVEYEKALSVLAQEIMTDKINRG